METSRRTSPEPKTAAAPRDADAGEEGIADTPQIRALRMAVIVMSLLLVVGFITVIARIIYLTSRSGAQPAAAAIGAAGPAAAVTLKGEVALPLPPGATIANAVLEGARLTVTYSAPGGGGIVVLDLESGRVLSRVRPTPEGAR